MADMTETTDDTGLPDNISLIPQDEDVVKRIRQCRRAANDKLGSFRKEAKECYAFLAGDQWNAEELRALEELRRVPVVFNRVEPTVESIAGHEVNNRQAVKFLPRQPAQDSQLNELLTNAADWVRDQCDAEDEESDAFVDMLSCGVGVTLTIPDYEVDPDGQILIKRTDPMLVRWDPAARQRNLVDRTWDQWDVRMSLTDIKRTWPDKAGEIESQEASANDGDDPYGDTEELSADAPGDEYDGKDNGKGGPENRRYRTVVWHEWFEVSSAWRVMDPATGQLEMMDDEQFQVLQGRLAEMNAAMGMPPPQVQAVRVPRRRYFLAKVCGNVLLERVESPTQEGFLLNFITGRRDRNKNTFYGVVRPMVSPQRFANSYLSQLHALIRSNAKGGLMVEEGATANVRELEEKWAQQDSVIKLNDGALSGGKIQPKPVSPLPSGPERLLEFSVSSIRDVTGVNLEALGMADRNQPGILEITRKESALTILAPLFNSLRRYRKVQGRVLADMIRRYISDGRLLRIVQGDGTEKSIPLLRLPDTMTFDVVVDSASNAPDQKARTFAVMSQMIPALEKSGFPTPPEILDYTPLPQSLTTAWKQAVQKKMQQPPQPPPEVLKVQIQTQADMAKAQAKLQFDQWKAQQDAQLEMWKAQLSATTKAQTEQLYAAINEQSQIINARANEAKTQQDALVARIEGMAKLVDTITKVRQHGEKQMEKVTRPPAIIAVPDQVGNEMMQAAVGQMAQAVGALTQSIQRPKSVLRDAAGNIVGVQ